MAAPFWYNEALNQLALGGLDLDNDSIRTALVMFGSTAATEADVDKMDGFSAPGLKEYDHGSYGRYTHLTTTLTENAGLNRLELDLDDALFASISAASEDCIGAVVLRHITNDSLSMPLFFFNFTAFNGTGNDVTIQWASQGVAFITGAGA